jgi:predicted metal-dependent phosphotriesterase family hydrolase
LENGFNERDIRKMVRDNPAQLLGARQTAAAAA